MIEAAEVELRIGKLQGIPALPTNVEKLITLTLDEEASPRKIAELISIDPALSAKLLRLVNSPFYSFAQRISTVTQAVVILGISSLRNIALSISVLDLFQNRRRLRSYLPRFLEHSLASGVAARFLAQETDYPLPEEAFMAGLLHDIGTLVLFECLPDLYPEVLNEATDRQVSLMETEVSMLGIHHARAGELLCRSWGLPRSLELAIRHHGDPNLQWKKGNRESDLIVLTRLASLAARALSDNQEGVKIKAFCQEVARLLGHTEEEARQILETIEPQVQEMAGCLDIRVPNLKGVFKAVLKASHVLGETVVKFEQGKKEMGEAIDGLKSTERSLRNENQQLQNLSEIDGLTEIYNHRYFQKRMSEEVSRALRLTYPLSLILIDLDHFKNVNDTYGHVIGDRVLKEFASLLKNGCRESDMVARYGGEEFTLILPNSNSKGAWGIVNRMKERLKHHNFGCTPPISLTFSAGIGTLLPKEKDKSPHELILEADQALLVAKKGGKDQICFGPAS